MRPRSVLGGGALLLTMVVLAFMARPTYGFGLIGAYVPDLFGIAQFINSASDWSPVALKVVSGPTGIVIHALAYASKPIAELVQSLLSLLSPGSLLYRFIEVVTGRIIEGVGNLVINFFWWILSLKKDFVVLVVEVIMAASQGAFSYISKKYFPPGGTILTTDDLDNLFYIQPFLERYNTIDNIYFLGRVVGDKDLKAERRLGEEADMDKIPLGQDPAAEKSKGNSSRGDSEIQNWRELINRIKNKDPDGCFLLYLCGLQTSQAGLLHSYEKYLRNHFRQYVEHLGNDAMEKDVVCGAQLPPTQDHAPPAAVATAVASSRTHSIETSTTILLMTSLSNSIDDPRKRTTHDGEEEADARDRTSADNEICEFLGAIFPYAKASWVGEKSSGQLQTCSKSYSQCPHEFSELQYTVNLALSFREIVASWT